MREEHAEHAAGSPEREREADERRREVERPVRIQKEDRLPDRKAEVRKAARERRSHQDRLTAKDADAFTKLVPERFAQVRLGRAHLASREQERRAGKRHGVRDQRERRIGEADEDAGEARPGEECGRVRELEARVRLVQVARSDDVRDVRRVREAEDDAAGTRDGRDDDELRDRQRPDRPCHRDRADHRQANQVGADQQRPPLQPVDPDPGDSASTPQALQPAAFRNPTVSELACSERIATEGSATVVTESPKTLSSGRPRDA